MTDHAYLLFYFAPLAIFIGLYVLSKRRKSERAERTLVEATEAGLTEPLSLHPMIDPAACLGCGSCVSACPEGDVIGLIRGKAAMIEPTHCIGHGACADACPTGAISLVFGTETRGVDIPRVGPDFQTNVPGIYIAGELGGMGLIRNAVEQGRQAIQSIAPTLVRSAGDVFDVVIVGAGPAGFAATLAAKEKGLKYLTLEQESLGGAVAHYPRGKLVMTQPAILPIVGKVSIRDPSKESLLAFWKETAAKTGIMVQYGERVVAIRPCPGGHEIETERSKYRSRAILLAIGRRGTPRKLGVPGEELPKVVYRMIDPAQYAGRRVAVVGGGDSALEAAAEIAGQPGAKVILSYRGAAFARARPRNRERVEGAAAQGNLKLFLNSEIAEIRAADISIIIDGHRKKAANDDVIICAGGTLPNEFLKSVGIVVDTKFGSK